MPPTDDHHRRLTSDEIKTLEKQRCACDDWSRVRVTDPFLPQRVVDARFSGDVRIGSLHGSGGDGEAMAKPAGIYRAHVIACRLQDQVRVANIGRHVANYHFGPGCVVENVGLLETRPGARFGNGVEVAVLNEAGGREVILFNQLSAQFAYLMCLYRHRPALIERLQHMAREAAAAVASDHGSVGAEARIVNAGTIVDVNIGPAAQIDSSPSLEQGTVLSHPEAPTRVGAGVMARDFIVAEGAEVSGGAMLQETFVGQGCRVGKQFSAEGTLLFANCEAFHGEACSVFAGPYTVTHHKSTLLIGGMFSFYNAGSGSNQSNHRYKLGPNHEGKLERGCKTGSSSYLLWPCRVGPFSVVLGKHTRGFDTSLLPFSHVEADSDGRCQVIPGHYLTTVGTLRDGRKWPGRDRRPAALARDQVDFAVFNPLTVGRMQRGVEILAEREATTERSTRSVTVQGAEIKRVLLRSGRKRYEAQVQRYLGEGIVNRLERWMDPPPLPLVSALGAAPDAVYCAQWVDVGGQLLPKTRVDDLVARIEGGQVASAGAVQEAFADFARHHEEDQWFWIRTAARAALGIDLDAPDPAALDRIVDDFGPQQQKFLRLILADAEREFDAAVQIGFGLDGGDQDTVDDFMAVRGAFDQNRFVCEVEAEIAAVTDRCDRIRRQLASLT